MNKQKRLYDVLLEKNKKANIKAQLSSSNNDIEIIDKL